MIGKGKLKKDGAMMVEHLKPGVLYYPKV